jgi:hypothetical protein
VKTRRHANRSAVGAIAAVRDATTDTNDIATTTRETSRASWPRAHLGLEEARVAGNSGAVCARLEAHR